MCEQCLAKATAIREDVLPGYTLMQAQGGSLAWPVDWYGLVQQNDPVIVFPGPLMIDPSAGLSDEAIEAFLPERNALTDRFREGSEGLRTALKAVPVLVGYELVSACLQSGYDVERDGTELGYWLMHHLAEMIQLSNKPKRPAPGI